MVRTPPPGCWISSPAGPAAPTDWLDERGEAFRKRVEIATLDPFQGYKNAIDDQLEDATCVLDAFHIVKLAGAAVDDVRRRIQQETLGHRGRKGDPLYGIRHVLRAGRERLTSRQQNRLASTSLPTPIMSRSKSPTSAPKTSATCSTSPPPPKADASPSS